MLLICVVFGQTELVSKQGPTSSIFWYLLRLLALLKFRDWTPQNKLWKTLFMFFSPLDRSNFTFLLNDSCVCLDLRVTIYLPAGDKPSRRWQSLQWMSDLGALVELVAKVADPKGLSLEVMIFIGNYHCRWWFHPQRFWPLLRRTGYEQLESSLPTAGHA